MKIDLLERAAAEVRERYDGSSARAARTEERVLLAVEKARLLRRTLQFTFAIPLLAALLASGAWAAAGEPFRVRLRAAIHARTAPRGSAPSAPREVPNAAGATGVLRPATPAPSEPTPANEVSVATTPVLRSNAQPASSGRAQRRAMPARAQLSNNAPAPAVTAAAAEPSVSEADIEALYRAAHRAQFSDHDPAHALELWDRYLAAAPNGSLSPEARYNRAIALARLGRNAEATVALEPFARGDYGAYRQVEAAALIRSLTQSAADR